MQLSTGKGADDLAGEEVEVEKPAIREKAAEDVPGLLKQISEALVGKVCQI